MNKVFKKISLVMAVGLSLTGMTACSDPDDAITSVEFNRLFCPTQLEAKVQNTTGVKLSWFAISNADQYSIEIYADDEAMSFSGTPLSYTATSTTDQARTECSWTLPAGTLEGETTYSVRVKAVGSSKESKWAATTFETGTEQILANVPTSNITKTSVTLTWPAGTAVTKINVEKDGEVILTHTLTTDEIAAGIATIGDLAPETEYTFLIYNGEKQRGKMKVETLPNFTPVTDAENLQAAIDAAESGEVIMLTENKVYDFTETETTAIKIEKDIVLNTNNGATIKGVYFQLYNGASLEFTNITLDGEGGSGDQAFNYKENGNYGKLYIHDAEIKNFTKGFFYINVKAVVDDITIKNCLIHDIECNGGDMFDSRAGGFNNFNLLNNTIYNSAKGRDFIRMDDPKDETVIANAAIKVDHNTIIGVSNSASKRILYVRFPGNSIVFTNNIIASTAANFSNQKSTVKPTFANNFYFEADGLVTAGTNANGLFVDEEGTTADPQFKDVANGDFTVLNEKVKDKEAGDPRWY